MTQPPALDFVAFRAAVAQTLGVEEEAVTPGAYFITDLGVDSIKMVEVLLKLEAWGVEIHPELAYDIHTVDDAYRYYRAHVAPAAGED